MNDHEKLKLGQPRFEVRFSRRDPNDIRLSWHVANAIKSGINVSAVAKHLLLAWFEQYEASGGNGTMPAIINFAGGAGAFTVASDDDELDMNDPIVQMMAAGMDFSALEGKSNV